MEPTMENPICIAVTGPESTGKSALSKQLAEALPGAVVVPEYARSYLESLPRKYTAADVEYIARRQLALERKMLSAKPRVLVCDTDLLVIRVWMEFVFGHCPRWIVNASAGRQYHLSLLTDIDLPWEADPLREHPDQRKVLFDLYQHHLKALGRNFKVIRGSGHTRLENALSAVNSSPMLSGLNTISPTFAVS